MLAAGFTYVSARTRTRAQRVTARRLIGRQRRERPAHGPQPRIRAGAQPAWCARRLRVLVIARAQTEDVGRRGMGAGCGRAHARPRFILLDDCWGAVQRTASGRISADRRRFPSGNGTMEELATWLHARGFKLGLYMTVGALQPPSLVSHTHTHTLATVHRQCGCLRTTVQLVVARACRLETRLAQRATGLYLGSRTRGASRAAAALDHQRPRAVHTNTGVRGCVHPVAVGAASHARASHTQCGGMHRLWHNVCACW